MHEFTLYEGLDREELLLIGSPNLILTDWFGMEVQVYGSDDCIVHLARIKESGPHVISDGSFSLDLQVSPAGELLSMGWSTDGTPISGQLVDRSANGDRILLPWMIDRVETCTEASFEPIYSAIHVCWCKPLEAPALAAV